MKLYIEALEVDHPDATIRISLLLNYIDCMLSLNEASLYDKVITCGHQVFALSPDHPKAYRLMATCLQRMGKVTEAKDFCKEGIVKNPNDKSLRALYSELA